MPSRYNTPPIETLLEKTLNKTPLLGAKLKFKLLSFVGEFKFDAELKNLKRVV